MKAVVSFQAGVALLEDSEGVQVLSVDGAPMAPTVRAAQHLLMSATDVMEQDVESVASLQKRLEIGFACDRGLQMLLILVDADEDLETRELAGECCEERLQSELVKDYVANRLHQQPLPEDTDIHTALRLAQQHTWTRTDALLNEIAAAQGVLKDLLDSLKNLPDNIIESAGWLTRTLAARQLADTGVLRSVCRSCRNVATVAEMILLLDSRYNHPGFETFLTKWIGPLNQLTREATGKGGTGTVGTISKPDATSVDLTSNCFCGGVCADDDQGPFEGNEFVPSQTAGDVVAGMAVTILRETPLARGSSSRSQKGKQWKRKLIDMTRRRREKLRNSEKQREPHSSKIREGRRVGGAGRQKSR